MDCSMPTSLSITNSPQFTQTHVHWVSDAIQPSHPLLSPSPLHSIFPSIRVFSNNSVLRIRWPKYCSFSFSISPSNDYSGLISFKMDWFDLLAVQGTIKSLLQHHSSKASILRHLYAHNTLFILESLTSWILLSSRIVGPIPSRYQEMPVCILVNSNVSILAHQL